MKTYAELANLTFEKFMKEQEPDRMAELADIYLAFAERDEEMELAEVQEQCRQLAERMEQLMITEMDGGEQSKPMVMTFPYLAARQIAEGGRKRERNAEIFHVAP